MKKIEFVKSKTIINLAKAYVMCSTLSTKLFVLSKECVQEGYKNISDILKKYSSNLSAYASVIEKFIITNATNIVANIELTISVPFKCGKELHENITYCADEYTTLGGSLLQSFAFTAKEENYNIIYENLMSYSDICKCHAKVLNDYASKLKSNKLYKYNKKTTLVCTNCGYKEITLSGWKKCPICDYPNGYIKLMND